MAYIGDKKRRGTTRFEEAYFSRDLTILKGTVPALDRGLEHMVPTYSCRSPRVMRETARVVPHSHIVTEMMKDIA